MNETAALPLAADQFPLVDLVCCPRDHAAPLRAVEGALLCPKCSSRFPVRDGIVSFLSAQEISEQDERERSMRDEESVWYDAMFEGYTDAVEIPAALRRLGRPDGPILDAGCGTGRITEALLALGRPVLGLDYSEACLRRMQDRTRGGAVLGVQADLRSLPIRTETMAGATCIETYSQFRPDDRRRVLAELQRVLAPSAVLSISAFNYNLLFRLWRLAGNAGAREGEHMLGGDYYYFRFRKPELRGELEGFFEVEELTGIRNIPARTIASALGRVGLARAGDRFLRYMVDQGHAADVYLEQVALSSLIGFFWQAKCRRRSDAAGR